MPNTPPPNSQFSPRERELVDKLLEGKSVKKIANALNISANTVKDYLKTVYQKAQVHSARELIVKLRTERMAQVPTEELMHASELLIDSRTVAELLERLLIATRMCSHSTCATLWNIEGTGTELAISNLGITTGPPVALTVTSAFFQRLVEMGSAELPDAEEYAEERQCLQPLEVAGELFGLRLRALGLTYALLIMDSGQQPLAAAEKAALRMLAHLAELRVHAFPATAVATA